MQICVDQNLGQSALAQNDKMTAGAFHEPDFDENLFTQGANTRLVKISEKLKKFNRIKFWMISCDNLIFTCKRKVHVMQPHSDCRLEYCATHIPFFGMKYISEHK